MLSWQPTGRRTNSGGGCRFGSGRRNSCGRASDRRPCRRTGGLHFYSFLNSFLEKMAEDLKNPDELTASLHVWPDFHGNRSPLADQGLKGMVVGLSLSQSLEDLALLYLATVQATALGTRHILEAMREAGHDISTMFLCGGLSKNPLFVQTHANVTGLPVVLPAEREAVLIGAAVLGACASGDYTSIQVQLS
ncbi:FGGY carbohydrate kinase domain-containing protein [Bagarius yarrelli]|uniref:FGGY carbohydrate kinase domain-containing protein n=1 Tax=Bagarius yarrelli TaxID=175774 RepID=A0A556V102_BAGYA|nr:FGGY carbohydrate kinase domain-containing protein [Bagarius yarrelli]